MRNSIGDLSNQQDYERGRSLGWRLHDLYRLFGKAWVSNLSKSGLPLSPMQGRVLANLFRDDGMTQTELADQVGMDKAPLGRMLDKMEAEGWVERRADPADRRVRRVFKTSKVDRVQPVLKERAGMMFSSVFADMSEGEVDRLLDDLAHMQANLERLVASDGSDRGE